MDRGNSNEAAHGLRHPPEQVVDVLSAVRGLVPRVQDRHLAASEPERVAAPLAAAASEQGVEAAVPERSKVVKSAALEAARSSTRGSGGAPSRAPEAVAGRLVGTAKSF